MLQIDNPHAMFQELLNAAKQYVAAALAHPVLGSTIEAQKELERAAVCYVRAAHQTYGAMWLDLKKILGVQGGSTEHEHREMLKKVETLKIERDEALRRLEVVQRDANVALEQRRESDRVAAQERDQTAAHERALELACDRANEYRSALETSAKTAIEMIDKIQKLETAYAELEQHYKAAHLVNEGFLRNPRAVELENENARLKQRVESAKTNLGYVRDALRSAENDLSYAEGKLDGDLE